MADDSKGRDTELILPPGVFAFVLDETKGHINTLCGPIKQSLSNTDRLVVFNSQSQRFIPVDRQRDAIQTNIIAPKGSYVVLENPSRTGGQPESSKAEIMPVGTLRYGQVENLPGPQSFPLWPGQFATVIEGHHLRSNQYLMVRVYDDEAAKANWEKSVIKSVSLTTDDSSEPSSGNVLGIDQDTLVTGQLLIIKGTDVAFYIPPTGVKVLTEDDGRYIRDAVTLERLEYAILIGEDGNKEYKIGPDVVFPTPTQKFFTKDSQRKFRAYELQPTNGIHIKVIADYEENEQQFTAGDELFITGADQPIYFPREEHAIISYGGNDKTYAVAIPSGEGRYVLDRETGDITLVTGPRMFLPNPIKEVIVRRILSDAECNLYFPMNAEVREFNRKLRDNGIDVNSDPATLAASIARSASASASVGAMQNNVFASSASLSAASASLVPRAKSADQMVRSTTYTPPRMITLNTKFEGAVRIDVWSGFAVQVINSRGDQRLVIGPCSWLLEYDEYLERLSLSTGTPKSDANRISTPYLRYISNPISDILSLKTKDLINVDVKVKYLVRFDKDQTEEWFAIDNYVQYLVDHLRSLISNGVRGIGIQAFYDDAVNIMRDIVLGPKTDGERVKKFTENGMVVYDLEVVEVTVRDRGVADLLAQSQREVLRDALALEEATAKTTLIAGIQKTARDQMKQLAMTDTARNQIIEEEINQQTKITLLRKQGEKAAADLTQVVNSILRVDETERMTLMARFDDLAAERQIEMERTAAENHKTRMEAIQPRLVEALTAMAQTGQLESIAHHLAPLALVEGMSLAGTLQRMMKGTPLEGMLDNLTKPHGTTLASN